MRQSRARWQRAAVGCMLGGLALAALGVSEPTETKPPAVERAPATESAAAVAGTTSTTSQLTAAARRVVAIGDIHGAYEGLITILRQSGLIDTRQRWIGGDAILVQTGDYLDRGARALRAAELLMDLQQQAPASGGEVIVLLGNHEILNLIGDLRDVTPEIVDELADERSEARRTVVCRAYPEFARQSARRRGVAIPSKKQARTRCLEEHPPGLLEYVAALGPEGRLGRWIRGHPTAVQVDDVVYLHGGLDPAMAKLGVAEVNRRVTAELRTWDESRGWLLEHQLVLPTSSAREVVAAARQALAGKLVDSAPRESLRALLEIDQWLAVRADGPLWFRGYARWSDEEGLAEMPGILASLDARHLVVGHTPQRPRSIHSRFNDSVFLIDTGMLSSVYTGGRPAALEIEQQTFTAIYVGLEKVLLAPPASAVGGVSGP